VVKDRLEDGLVLSSPGLTHPLKVDPDASVVDNVPVWVALRPKKSCSAMSRRRMATTLR
jgi:putrescine transport system ATP-binding protein